MDVRSACARPGYGGSSGPKRTQSQQYEYLHAWSHQLQSSVNRPSQHPGKAPAFALHGSMATPASRLTPRASFGMNSSMLNMSAGRWDATTLLPRGRTTAARAAVQQWFQGAGDNPEQPQAQAQAHTDSLDNAPRSMFDKSPTLNGKDRISEEDGLCLTIRPDDTISHQGPDQPGKPNQAEGAHSASLPGQQQQQAGSQQTGNAAPPSVATAAAATALDARIAFAYKVSCAVNLALLLSKLYAWQQWGSKAVLASLADSCVDLVSQVIIFAAEAQSHRSDPRFPVGQARLETMGVLACALIMALAAFEVIKESAGSLCEGLLQGAVPSIDAGLVMYLILGCATGAKILCYMLCNALAARSDSMVALAEDHRNDVMSNAATAVTAAVAGQVTGAWWVDPFGAIAISLYILYRWYRIAKTQIGKIVGRAAPTRFVEQLRAMCNGQYENVQVDRIRAYHFGAKYMVEMEIVMPETCTLREVHDVSLRLQDQLEALDQVERAFVHADYERREHPEHRTERLLQGLPVIQEASLDSDE